MLPVPFTLQTRQGRPPVGPTSEPRWKENVESCPARHHRSSIQILLHTLHSKYETINLATKFIKREEQGPDLTLPSRVAMYTDFSVRSPASVVEYKKFP